tara:strand:- start:219 stop:329 length:111 start_codon:yes stop_codon:yes gene_type:complete
MSEHQDNQCAITIAVFDDWACVLMAANGAIARACLL